MAYTQNEKSSGLDTLTTLAADDVVIVGDTSDSSRAKAITKTNLVTDIEDEVTITASQVSDFDTEVANNAAVTANTAKVSYTDSAAVGLNTTHRTSDGSDHTFIDQDVTSGSAPVLDATNFTNLPSGTPEGTAVLSTGETGGTKFLREDGDGTSSWQTVAAGGAVDSVNTQTGVVVLDTDDLLEGTNKYVTAADVTNLGNLSGTNTGDQDLSGKQDILAEGAFIDGDKTKLDAIEASADVTDTANVTSAGALMDSEVTNLAQVKAFDTTDYATAAQGTTADSAMQDLVDDTTPTLGGELDAGANSIGFTMQTATGDGTTTIDFKNGQHFEFTFGAFNEVFTLTAPTKPGVFTLALTQDSVGSRTATFSPTPKWAGGVAPTLTTTATTGRDLISLRWNGTTWDGVASLNFS